MKILIEPSPNGTLLVTVDNANAEEFEAFEFNAQTTPIGNATLTIKRAMIVELEHKR